MPFSSKLQVCFCFESALLQQQLPLATQPIFFCNQSWHILRFQINKKTIVATKSIHVATTKIMILCNNPILIDASKQYHDNNTVNSVHTMWQVASTPIAAPSCHNDAHFMRNKSIQDNKFAEIICTRSIQLTSGKQNSCNTTVAAAADIAAHQQIICTYTYIAINLLL